MPEAKAASAVETFTQGFNCAQAVFTSLGPDEGIDRDVAMRVAGAFGGGIARHGEVCGALTGACMALGLKHASASNDPEAKLKTYQKVDELMSEFRACHGSILCRELIGCDLRSEEARSAPAAKEAMKSRCPLFVRDAAEIAGRLMGE